MHSERVKKLTVWVKGETYSGWKIATGLEFLQGHGAGVSAKKEDERHEGDVRDIITAVAHKVSSIFQALLLRQRRPVNGGVVLQKKKNISMMPRSHKHCPHYNGNRDRPSGKIL